MRFRATALAALVPFLVPAVARAQAPPVPPDVYALTNARIVAAPGRVIERGTVVVQDGRIAAVGANVSVPADAVRMDLNGLSVYPGLIDVASAVGLPRPAPAGGFGGGGAAAARPREAGTPYELSASRTAAEAFSAPDTVLRPYLEAGFTTLGLAFEGGIFPGQTSVVRTGGAAGESRVLRTPVATQVAFGRRRDAYPETLMGALAFIEQQFLDARRGGALRESFARDPGRTEWPVHDPLHTALEPAATGAQPVWIAASRENDLRRAVALAKRLGLNYTLLGAQEGWLAADLLAAERRPVIVSVDFPRAGQVTGRALELHVAPVSGNDEARSAADSAAARRARGNAAALARAGVPFALSGFGVERAADVLTNVRAAIDAGLSRDDALRALTITPARVLGLDRALGTIEPGKVADLVVTEGDLFARDARVRHVFVHGVRNDVREQPRERAGRGRAAAGDTRATVAGEWQGTFTGAAEIAMTFTLRVTLTDSVATATLGTAHGETELSGRVRGSELQLRGDLATGGGATPAELTATLRGDRLEGTLNATGHPAAPFTATRSARAPEQEP